MKNLEDFFDKWFVSHDVLTKENYEFVNVIYSFCTSEKNNTKKTKKEPTEKTKICTSCQTAKPLSEFYKSEVSKNGFCYQRKIIKYCKECQKKIVIKKMKGDK